MLGLISCLALCVFIAAGYWKVFVKAGFPGWGALVPIYNCILWLRVAGRPGWWFFLLLIPFVNLVIYVIASYDVATKFAKGMGFTFGLIVLPFVFYPILGFGSATYHPTLARLRQQGGGAAAATASVPGQSGSGLAIGSLVLGVFTLLTYFIPFLPLLLGLLTIGFGIMGIRQVGQAASGKGMALAGIVCAAVGMIPSLMMAASFVEFMIAGPQIVVEQSESWEDSEQLEEFERQFGNNSLSQPRPAKYGKQDDDPTKTILQQPQSDGYFSIPASAFAFSPDGMLVAGVRNVSKFDDEVGGGGEILLWDATTGELIETLKDLGESVRGLEFSRDGSTLAITSRQVGATTDVAESQSVVTLWDLGTRELIRSIQLAGPCSFGGKRPLVLLDPEGRTLVTVVGKAERIGNQTRIEPGDMVAWDVQTGAAKWTLPTSSVRAMTLSPDAAMLIGCVRKMKWRSEGGELRGDTLDSNVTFWDMGTGEVVKKVDASRFRVNNIMALPGGETLVGLGGSNNVMLFDIQSGETRPMTSRGVSGDAIAVSADGAVIALGGTGRLVLLDIQTGKILGERTADFGWWHPQFSSDLLRIACNYKHQATIIDLDWTPESVTKEASPKEASALADVAEPPSENQAGTQATVDDNLSPDPKSLKTWTDNTGTRTIQAEFLGIDGRRVTLKRIDGRVFTFDVGRLSTEDQQHLEKLAMRNE